MKNKISLLKIGKKVFIWGPFFVWSFVIYYLSSKQLGTAKLPLPDYVFHISEYFIFALLLYRALNSSGYKRKHVIVWTLIVSFLYAVFDEIHQSFVPGRHSDFKDVISDTIGAAIAVFILWKLLPKMPVKLVSLARKLDLV